MRIDSSGNVLVGKTSANAAVAGAAIEADGDAYFTAEGANGRVLYLNRLSSDGDIIQLAKDGSSVGNIGNTGDYLFLGSDAGSDSYVLMGNSIFAPATSTGAARNAAIDLGTADRQWKDLHLSGGVVFGPASASTVASQTLDSYEEGTFTPSCSFQNATNNNAKNIDSALGSYVKIGEFVYFNLVIVLDVPSSLANDNFNILSLPFSSRNIDTLDQPQPFLMQGIATTTPLFILIPHNANYGYLADNNLAGNQGDALNSADNQKLIVCGSYRVN
tara:strand:- start:54 stop:875 length:822 start_codon:yes stop_codon:yes gene_type:complete